MRVGKVIRRGYFRILVSWRVFYVNVIGWGKRGGSGFYKKKYVGCVVMSGKNGSEKVEGGFKGFYVF